jgi:hypothetical protein
MFSKPINPDMVVPTSKVSLKMSCLRACNNDVEKAAKLYDFFVKEMQNIPDFDPVPPSMFEQAKSTIGDLFGWLDNNQDKLAGAFQLIQQFRGGGAIATGQPPVNVPPLP